MGQGRGLSEPRLYGPWPDGPFTGPDWVLVLVIQAARIARAVLDEREQKGLSREALAAEMGVSAQTIYNLEHGRCLPDFATLVLLADALKIALVIDPTGDLSTGDPDGLIDDPGTTL